MKTIIEYQASVGSISDGRFIPHVGKEYANGLECNYPFKESTNLKILVIGPRHYCDAEESFRNRNANVLNLLNKKNPSFNVKDGRLYIESNGEIIDEDLGCTLSRPEECLKNRPFNCPVFKAKRCPVSKDCKIWEVSQRYGVDCEGMRNLRCETLIAIEDFLNDAWHKNGKNYESSNFVVPDQNLGRTNFSNITEFIVAHFVPNRSTAKELWDCIAFTNLIQRHISDSKYKTNEDIMVQIRNEDVEFINEMIKILEPDVIIATMPCVKSKLKIKNLGFVDWRVDVGKHFFVGCKQEVEYFFNRWKEILRYCVEKSVLPSKSVDLLGFLGGIVEGILYNCSFLPSRENIVEQLHDFLELKVKECSKNASVEITESEMLFYAGDKDEKSERGRYAGKEGLKRMISWLSSCWRTSRKTARANYNLEEFERGKYLVIDAIRSYNDGLI